MAILLKVTFDGDEMTVYLILSRELEIALQYLKAGYSVMNAREPLTISDIVGHSNSTVCILDGLLHHEELEIGDLTDIY